ncbi:hypothetical protein GGTG_03616 [Gaeumannomyces tritici R3-111a-1]|uniref:Uncharacterized protein n=1 Tax=Gaeumannomyces tritici (strain R3-111a-1) TaxID=644352 RepID=J3NQR0_GAET3|nr:hypothetical protein GGTG_03616 [Gaeumannomyces tritici R3-111a-1]EJT78516.1 hypothetical protein GGTG_03616 [Gaeumannomyces tritici R3-111a-1]
MVRARMKVSANPLPAEVLNVDFLGAGFLVAISIVGDLDSNFLEERGGLTGYGVVTLVEFGSFVVNLTRGSGTEPKMSPLQVLSRSSQALAKLSSGTLPNRHFNFSISLGTTVADAFDKALLCQT